MQKKYFIDLTKIPREDRREIVDNLSEKYKCRKLGDISVGANLFYFAGVTTYVHNRTSHNEMVKRRKHEVIYEEIFLPELVDLAYIYSL